MFGSNVLEVGVGLIFTFLTVSLISGAVVEGAASFLKLRSTTLLSEMKALLNDPKFDALAKDLYAHAAVNPRGPGSNDPEKNQPAYIDKNQFAAALMDITNMSKVIAAHANENAGDAPGMAPPVAPGPGLIERLKAAVDAKMVPAGDEPAATAPVANEQIQQLLHGIIDRSLGNAEQIQAELAQWFDNGMDRVSGVYKRYTQAISVAVALVLAVVLNVNTITIAKAVWEQPTLVANIKVANAAPSMEDARKTLDKTVPVGWPAGYFKVVSVDAKNGKTEIDENGKEKTRFFFETWDCPIFIFGWLLTALSALFGAPFWFDALQQITRLKGSGPSPTEKKSGAAASA